MEDAFDMSIGVGDDQEGDAALFEESQCARGEFVGGKSHGRSIHRVTRGVLQSVAAVVFQQAAQVAVAEDAKKLTVLLDGGHAEFFAAHLVDHVDHGGLRRDDGDGLASVHEVADAGQLTSEFSARMKFCEVLCTKAFAQAYGDGERVAESKHGGGGSSWREVERTGFALDGAVERDFAGGGKRGGEVAGEADEGIAFTFENRQQAENFFRFPTCGKREDKVAGQQCAEVAVNGFCRVEKMRG